MDQRITKMAETIVRHSTRVGRGDKVLIETFGNNTAEMRLALERAVRDAGGSTSHLIHDPFVDREWIMRASPKDFQHEGLRQLAVMRKVECYIGIRGGENALEQIDIPTAQMRLYRQWILGPVHLKQRVPKTRWCITRWPSGAMAQAAQMSTLGFRDFYFAACGMDYTRMARAMQPLKRLMERTNNVRIVGPDTDLTFSIKNIPAVICAATYNIPDGEVYTAPVRLSVNGTLQYNTPTLYDGTKFENVRLVFKKGKIVEATCAGGQEMLDKLNAILNTDKGARFVGEFAIGVNPFITKAMMDILFDEKISGSIHFTPGNSYNTAPNGNHSGIHWDMVLIQRQDHGGGELWFDNKLVRRDGLFVPKTLQGMNPDHLAV